MTWSGSMISMSWPASIMPGGDHRGPAHLEVHALGRVAVQAQRQRLEVEDDVGDVLAHAGDGRELVQHAVDLRGGDRGALQRGQQHAAQRVAERHAEAALERLGDDRGLAVGPLPGQHLELGRLDQFLPVLLDHGAYLEIDQAGASGQIGALGGALPVPRAAHWPARRPARPLRSDPAALARPAAVVRDRRHVADRGDREADAPAARAAPIRGPSRARGPRPRGSSCRAPSPCGRPARPRPARRTGSTCASR